MFKGPCPSFKFYVHLGQGVNLLKLQRKPGFGALCELGTGDYRGQSKTLFPYNGT